MNQSKTNKNEMKTVGIFIYLPLEAVDTWRPTNALDLGNGYFKVLTTPDYDPEDEAWEFTPDTIVECEEKVLNGEKCLVAVRSIS